MSTTSKKSSGSGTVLSLDSLNKAGHQVFHSKVQMKTGLSNPRGPTHSPKKSDSISTKIFAFKVTGYLPESFFFFAQKNFEAKLNITSLASFSKTKKLQILRRARIINKRVFSNEILSPTRVL